LYSSGTICGFCWIFHGQFHCQMDVLILKGILLDI
jgi:hypothetical protein